jgi:hypothetical protein
MQWGGRVEAGERGLRRGGGDQGCRGSHRRAVSDGGCLPSQLLAPPPTFPGPLGWLEKTAARFCRQGPGRGRLGRWRLAVAAGWRPVKHAAPGSPRSGVREDSIRFSTLTVGRGGRDEGAPHGSGAGASGERTRGMLGRAAAVGPRWLVAGGHPPAAGGGAQKGPLAKGCPTAVTTQRITVNGGTRRCPAPLASTEPAGWLR